MWLCSQPEHAVLALTERWTLVGAQEGVSAVLVESLTALCILLGMLGFAATMFVLVTVFYLYGGWP